MPYLAYDEVDFDVIVGTVGDTFDRYAVRLNEIRESIRSSARSSRRCRAATTGSQDKKVTPPPRARIDESMEALIHHFKLFTRGIEAPAGEVYVAVESPRGELGCYLVSDGSNKPYRMHVRAPSFVNLQSVPALLRGGLIADAIADLLLGRPGPRRGRPLMAHLTDENLRQGARRSSRSTRSARSALIPLCHLAQAQDGYLTDGGDGGHRRARRRARPPRCAARRASTTCCTPSRSAGYVVAVCTNIACMLAGAYELLEHAEELARDRASARRPTTAMFTLEEAECLAGCDLAPCVQVNHRFFGPLDAAGFDRLVDDLALGRARRRRCRRHGVLEPGRAHRRARRLRRRGRQASARSGA